MKTIQLQLNKKITALSLEHPSEYTLFRYMLIFAGALVVLYLYFVSSSVLNVIAQREADSMAAKLESRLGELEGRYFSLSQNITAEHAAELGLKPLADSSYVYRLSTVGVATVPQNAI